MALEQYRAKRNFTITPEPRGVIARKKGVVARQKGVVARQKGVVARQMGQALAYVIQKHAASHLHYDFRLELGGVLLSWAVPKGPSLDPADKRLAMHVEDHPIEYGNFEGVIPPKQYGAGAVMLWDRGTWEPIGDASESYRKGHLKFVLHGEKLHGRWALVKTHGSRYGGNTGEQAWLLIKDRDEYAERNGTPIVDLAPDSVVSQRSLDAIGRARDRVWHSNQSAQQNVKAGAIARPGPAARARTASTVPAAGAIRAKLPAMLSPMLATLAATPPSGNDWIQEVKYDGYRMLCRIHGGKAHLYSRSGKDWTARLAPIARDLAKLPVSDAWLDGEAVVLDAHGRTSFQRLQNALALPEQPDVTFFVFDVVYRDGFDLRGVALTERKRLLRELVGTGGGTLRVGPEFRGGADEFLRQACSLGLEGALCKRADSLYVEGVRTRDWLKVKCRQRQEMVIGGYTDPKGSRIGFGALLLGTYDGGVLRYAGRVGTGFDDRTLAETVALLARRAQAKTPFANPPRGFEAKGVHWVRPDLVAEIAFAEWSDDGALRHPSFRGLRLDKRATDVVREEPMTATTAKTATTANQSARKSASPPARARDDERVAGIAISNPAKSYFPEAGITKRDVALYVETMAPWLLPHVKNRPLSLVRCPDGWTGQCFYQKHADKSVNAAVARIAVPEGDGTAMYMGANSARALVALVQWGVLELHPWGSRTPRLDRPDQLIFDFDPDDAVDWAQLVAAVQLLRTMLEELGLVGFLKTTGGKGLHVVVPIRPTIGWEQAKGFTKAVAQMLARTFPDRFTAEMAKTRRKGRIFVDYLRNAEGATAVAAYSVRARKNAPVSTPIAWEELARDVRFDFFNLRNVPKRVAGRFTDPWQDFAAVRQSITRARADRVGFALT